MSDIVAELKTVGNDFCARLTCVARPGDVMLEAALEIERLRKENEALREALKPFSERCADVESYIAEYPEDHPASNPDAWFTGFAWDDLLRARALYEGEVK